MRTLSFDSNCVIEVEEGRAQLESVLALVEASRRKDVSVALLATSASETLKDLGQFPGSYHHFDERIRQLGWSDLEVLPTPAVVGLTYIGKCYWVDEDDYPRLRNAIWRTLFPNVPSDGKRSVDETNLWSASKEAKKFRNAWCDVHSLMAHIEARRSAFVTTNTKDFHRHSVALAELGAGEMVTPDEAVQKYLRSPD